MKSLVEIHGGVVGSLERRVGPGAANSSVRRQALGAQGALGAGLSTNKIVLVSDAPPTTVTAVWQLAANSATSWSKAGHDAP